MRLGRHGQLTDVLIYEAALALWFWVPYRLTIIPEGVRQLWPSLELAWFAVWISSPFLTLVGVLAIPRALKVPGGWLQVIIAGLLAYSVWWQAARIEF